MKRPNVHVAYDVSHFTIRECGPDCAFTRTSQSITHTTCFYFELAIFIRTIIQLTRMNIRIIEYDFGGGVDVFFIRIYTGIVFVRRTCRHAVVSCAFFDSFLIKGFAKVFTDSGHSF